MYWSHSLWDQQVGNNVCITYLCLYFYSIQILKYVIVLYQSWMLTLLKGQWMWLSCLCLYAVCSNPWRFNYELDTLPIWSPTLVYWCQPTCTQENRLLWVWVKLLCTLTLPSPDPNTSLRALTLSLRSSYIPPCRYFSIAQQLRQLSTRPFIYI